jgi:hypothetical protein
MIFRWTDVSWFPVGVEEFAGQRQTCRAACIRQVSELADANEATWQDVLGKTAEKLMRGEGHFALLAAMRVVLPAESNILAIESQCKRRSVSASNSRRISIRQPPGNSTANPLPPPPPSLDWVPATSTFSQRFPIAPWSAAFCRNR